MFDKKPAGLLARWGLTSLLYRQPGTELVLLDFHKLRVWESDRRFSHGLSAWHEATSGDVQHALSQRGGGLLSRPSRVGGGGSVSLRSLRSLLAYAVFRSIYICRSIWLFIFKFIKRRSTGIIELSWLLSGFWISIPSVRLEATILDSLFPWECSLFHCEYSLFPRECLFHWECSLFHCKCSLFTVNVPCFTVNVSCFTVNVSLHCH